MKSVTVLTSKTNRQDKSRIIHELACFYLIEYVSVVYLTNWLHVQTLSVVFLAALVESVAKKLIQCVWLLLLMKIQVVEIVVRHDVEDHETKQTEIFNEP